MITVVGGTYREIDYDDISLDIFGSGFRGAKFLLENNCPVHLYSTGNAETLNFLKENQKVYSDFTFEYTNYDDLITFKYSFSLDQPTIFPNLLNIPKSEDIKVDSGNIIAFGMLESDFQLTGNKVVYDPQTSLKPKSFSQIGKAEELVYVLNLSEAQSIASSKNINDIKDYFYRREKVKALIIKNGPFGATLYSDNKEFHIPSFVTNNVNKIGSGDIFTSSFGYYWMEKQLSLEESALNASKSTAYFCDKKVYVDSSNIEGFEYQEFKKRELSGKQVYLAAPFFSISELILIDKIRTAFLAFGVKVFSPFHDVGLGDDVTLAKKDIEGIENSDIIFCVFDNIDSGTLVESGYSLAKRKKIIGYHRTCNEGELLMLKPGDIKTFNHLTTAIYQTIWNI
ncbi:nucleoside 2-deoxyribosyltransferase [Echinicola marina]|uniref:PfkB family carbohydrate kinase n=1 Tax=Echinicola marina TaxID=2859768 RepID=UPI001CF63EEC|nr:PfkB family carbohydrate kinase [Echinicola marina]UCS93951.1 nucleoside 2-deoxyribosyltransferase [Echinicola marina]